MYIFVSYYKNYRTFVKDGDKRVPVIFSEGKLEVRDKKLAELIIKQKLGKDPFIKMWASMPEGEKNGREKSTGEKGGGKATSNETKKVGDDTPTKTKRKSVSKSQKDK